MARPPDVQPLVKLGRASFFSLCLTWWVNETARLKIIWIIVHFLVVNSFLKTVIKLIWQVSPIVIRWCTLVLLIHASSSLIFLFEVDTVNSNTFSSVQKISSCNRLSVFFSNFAYGFLFAMTHYESRLSNHLVNLCYKN